MGTPRGDAAAAGDISLLDLAVVAAEHWKLLVLGPLLFGLLALGYAFTITPTFTAKTTFLPPQQQGSAVAALQALGPIAGLAGAAAGVRNPAEQYVALLTSRTVLERVLDRFELMKVYGSKYRELALRSLEGNIKASTGKNGLIAAEVEDDDPRRAAAIANALTEELGILLGRLALTEAQTRRQFFERQLKDTKDALGRSQIALQSSGVNTNALKMQPEAAVSEVSELRARVVGQELALDTMRNYLAETAPDLRRARNDLAALKRQLSKVAAAEPATGGDADYVAKYREYKYQETLFDLFARQFEAAKLDESRDSAVIQVVDRALPPELKSKPRKAFIAVAATLAAGTLLLLFVFARLALRSMGGNAENAAKMSRLKSVLRLGRRA